MSLDPSRYAELFRTESREQLSAINRALLLLEEGGDHAEPVSVVFRAVHTMKGMSATMGYHAVAEFAHELESVLDRVRSGDQALTAGLMDALFASADALGVGRRERIREQQTGRRRRWKPPCSGSATSPVAPRRPRPRPFSPPKRARSRRGRLPTRSTARA